MNTGFWQGRRVFITGHTGFKGSWLSVWLANAGSHLVGYALEPPTSPNLFDQARLEQHMVSLRADIRDGHALADAMEEHQPEIVFHMAAQSLVRPSYIDPVGTYETNVLGLVHLFEAVRRTQSVRVVINVTSDKCYENRETFRGYREEDPMGGFDPYSCSKGCAELVTASYRKAFFQSSTTESTKVALASVRAGNVIGGGDWTPDRLIPDVIKAMMANQPIQIRNPHAVRPWQHVLEPLSGYLLLAEKLWHHGHPYAQGWNFGPDDDDAVPVAEVVTRLSSLWGSHTPWSQQSGHHPHEAHHLHLDCAKARLMLGWHPRWSLQRGLTATVAWFQGYQNGVDLHQLCCQQIAEYVQTRS